MIFDLERTDRRILLAHNALDHLGRIDVVFNVLGASQAPAGGFAALDDKAWRKEIDLA